MSVLGIALVDAANNCQRDGGEAILTLRSGQVIRGMLERNATQIAHIKTASGGWATVLVEEIAAVGVERRL